MEQKLTVDLNQAQMRQAAAAGVQLLNTPGAVSVPSQMALTDNVKVLNSMLMAIMNGEVLLLNARPKAAEEEGKTPPDDDDGEKKPDLKSVEGGKKDDEAKAEGAEGK